MEFFSLITSSFVSGERRFQAWTQKYCPQEVEVPNNNLQLLVFV